MFVFTNLLAYAGYSTYIVMENCIGCTLSSALSIVVLFVSELFVILTASIFVDSGL